MFFCEPSRELLPFDEVPFARLIKQTLKTIKSFLFPTVNPVYIIVGNPQVILIERKLADSNPWFAVKDL